MNSLAFTLFFVFLTLCFLGALVLIAHTWAKMEDKWNVEILFSVFMGLAFVSVVLFNVASTTKVLVENPRYCWSCEPTQANYLVEQQKPLTLKELFPVNLDAIEIEVSNAWYYRKLYFDIILHDTKYSQAFNQCVFVAVTGRFETIWGNLLLTTRFSQEEVESRISLCRDALQE